MDNDNLDKAGKFWNERENDEVSRLVAEGKLMNSDWHVEIDGVMVPVSELEDSKIAARYFKDNYGGRLTGRSYPIIILPDKDPHGYIDGFFLLGKVVGGLLLIGAGVFFILWFGGL